MKTSKITRRVLILTILIITIVGMPVTAQGRPIVVSLAVPGYLNEVIKEEITDQFEMNNPGVHVHLVSYDNIPVYTPDTEIESYLDDLEAYANAADVVLVISTVFPVEASRSGYFHDLTPLVNADTTLDVSDFYPVIWDAFQWDNGIWALPGFADLTLLNYDPEAFDAAGLPYPDASWTINDFENALQELTQYDADNNVTVPGLLHLGNFGPLLTSLLGHGVYDDSGFSTMPQFDDVELEDLMTRWVEWEDSGMVRVITAITEEAPMRLWPARIMALDPASEMALLPGGHAGWEVIGFAVSSGTQHPEVAYELAKYITNQPDLMNAFYATPARRSLSGIEPEGELKNMNAVPESLQPLIQMALETELSASGSRFTSELVTAIRQMVEEDVDARSKLQEMAVMVEDNVRVAEERSNGLDFFVDNPPLAEVAPDEIALKFGLVSLTAQVPNQERWDALATQFVEADEAVGQFEVVLRIPFSGFSVTETAEDFDCFYLSSNVVPGVDLNALRNIDALLASDAMYDEADIVNSVMMQVQRDDLTWAMPLDIQPQPIWYNPTLFEQADTPMPYEGWTTSDFENAVRGLKLDPDAPAPFQAEAFGPNHLLSLIAAYGGMPLDYRTRPVTANYTDPATVNAIRQVLELAKQGYIEYEPFMENRVGPGIGRPDDAAMFTRLLNVLAFFGYDAENDPYRMVTFPQGTDYVGMAYDLGAIYISANTPYPEACYRFIQMASSDAELVLGMPARRSVINSDALALTQGEDAATYFAAFDELLQRQDIVVFPTLFQVNLNYDQVIGDYLTALWLQKAFDNYVLEDVDLEAELELAQMNTENFQSCIATIPPLDPSTESATEHVENYTDCATQVDPEMAGILGTDS